MKRVGGGSEGRGAAIFLFDSGGEVRVGLVVNVGVAHMDMWLFLKSLMVIAFFFCLFYFILRPQCAGHRSAPPERCVYRSLSLSLSLNQSSAETRELDESNNQMRHSASSLHRLPPKKKKINHDNVDEWYVATDLQKKKKKEGN